MQSKGFVDELKMILPKLESFKEQNVLERLFLQLDYVKNSSKAFAYLNLN